MQVKQTIPCNSGIFFITFTCHQWLPLIDETNGYDIVYNWFDHLKSKGHFINGFVIMPNHVRMLINFINAKQSINTILGNRKIFMAYKMIEKLKEANETALLKLLANLVEAGRNKNNKQHEVWELSFILKAFGSKDCRSNAFIYQKLDYMHNNPFVKKWALCNNALEDIHSSAKFYFTGEQGFYPLTNFMQMEDVPFNENK